jgi:anti-sigma regulatory factor (Ser/Thr protein kinase)
MRTDEPVPASAGAVLAGGGSSLPELERLRAAGRRQATLIDTLRAAVSNLSTGAKALKAENSELRAEIARLRGPRRHDVDADAHLNGAELAEVAIPFGSTAPGAARTVIERCLTDQVASSVLENARLLMSELVTNSVRHRGAADGDVVIVRVHLWRDVCRLEVEDPGSDGVIAPKSHDVGNGSGMGLNLVQMLSERWGVVRAGEGPTRVWAQLSCTPTAADARPRANGGPPPATRSA